jgi:glutaredoxin-dependent peroxiredoxin
MPLSPGDLAPDFTLLHRVGSPPVQLATELEKGPVVILFFPLAFSPTCTTEICTVAESRVAWAETGCGVLGISVDSPWVNDRFARECGADFPILSDFNREVAAAWDVLNEDFFGMRGVANRAAFVVDGDGVIRWAWEGEDADLLPDFDAIRQVVQRLDAPAPAPAPAAPPAPGRVRTAG